MTELIGRVKNGNYTMELWSDGTKVRYNDLDFFQPESIESCDLKITNCCDMGCAMCHENSTPNGKHGDIMNLKFIDTLLPYTEIAIGGGNTLTHPDLVPFLEKLKSRKLIANLTVNQNHFMNSLDFLHELTDNGLIHGLGVSMVNPDEKFIEAVKSFPNAVVHTICGVVTMSQLQYIGKKHIKILILGYKVFRRGEEHYKRLKDTIEYKKALLYAILPMIVHEGWFSCISFDNLAIEQLEPQRLMGEKEWERMYMGDDGFATMYVDAVNQEFAVSSTSTKRYKLMDNIKDMFDVVKAEKKGE